jgi:hypothetical protein
MACRNKQGKNKIKKQGKSKNTCEQSVEYIHDEDTIWPLLLQ